MKPQSTPKSENELVKYVEDRISSCKKDVYEMQGYLNISYFAGKQWIAWDRQNGRLYEPPKESWQVRFIANKIQPIVRTELAKITKNKFIMQVAPATSEDDDIKAARTAEKIIGWLEYELDLQAKDRENCLWGLTTGVSFVKPYWNASKGMELQANLYQGDVDVDIVSIFDIKWDSSASKWQDVKWICQEKVRDVAYVKDVYNVEVPSEGGLVCSNLYEAKLSNISTLGEGVSFKAAENSVVVREYWEKPSAMYKKGRRITTAAGRLLLYDEDIGFGPDDTSERELPFFPFFHINVPGRLIPTCVVEQLLPIQREYNKSRSQIIENKNLMANPIWLMPESCMNEEITNMPGGVYEYNPNFGKPEIIDPPMTGVDVYKSIEMCQEEFEFVSGQHEVSNGQTPSGVTSGVAIGYLQEQDDTKLGPTIANFIACKQKYMRYLLKMIQSKYDMPRVIRLVGENKKVEVMSFAGSDLTSIDVRIQEGSMYQMTRSAKQDWIIKLVQNGVLNAEKDKALIIKMLELGITDSLYDEYEIDSSQAQNEQDRWSKADMSPDVRDYYNHEVHISEHNHFRKEDIYNNMHPYMKAAVDEHVNKHLDFIMKKTIEKAKDTGSKQSIEQQEDRGISQTPAYDKFMAMQQE